MLPTTSAGGTSAKAVPDLAVFLSSVLSLFVGEAQRKPCAVEITSQSFFEREKYF